MPALTVPPPYVRCAVTAPALPTGVVAVIDVSELIVKVAAVPPKSTPVTPVKPVPTMFTVVNPARRALVRRQAGDRGVA